MTKRRITSALAAVAIASTSVAAGTLPAGAASSTGHLGHKSLAAVLAADGHHFDHNRHDFDIADKVIHRVLAARPHSPLAILTHGRQRVTVFLPTDGAFRRAAVIIVGKHLKSERRVYRGLMRVGGIGGAQNVLLTHLVSDRTLTYHRLATMAPTRLTSMQGAPLKLRYRDGRVVVVDGDPVSPNSWGFRDLRNINGGNRQIAQGVSALISPSS